jgi:tetratricopeptide (TPR) repeat protein
MDWLAARLGDYDTARIHCQTALTLRRGLGNTYGSANTLDHLGHPHTALGQYQQARTAWRQALDLYQQQRRTQDAQHVQTQLDTLNHPEHR